MKLKYEKKVKDIMLAYDTDGDLWQDLIELEEKIENPDIIIPILGTQGMGKSTLINAFIGEDVLPSEADETTCIPVEIRYGNSSATVVYKNGKEESIEIKKNIISQYVDNNYNPGNRKGISHIVLRKPYDVLRNGTVIVDLPGVGSLTKENEETTRKYIEKLCAAIFVISTSPPILESDARFIKSIWRGISSAYFVQNVWDDNSAIEIEEGETHNRNVLKSISKDIGGVMTSDIIPINVYAAAKGAFSKDKSLIQSSNMNSLVDSLEKFALYYAETVQKNFVDRIGSTIEIIVNNIENTIRQSQMSREELVSELKRERKLFQESSDEINVIIQNMETRIFAEKRESKQYARSLAKKKADLVKTETYHLIENGVVDGEQLTKAFMDNQILYGTEACDEASEEIIRVAELLQKEFEELQALMEKEKMSSIDATKFYKEQELKWEKGLRLGIDVGSGIGGVVVGDIVAGAVAGAIKGTALGSAAGPIGVAAGIVVGIGIGIVGGLIGNGIHKAKLNQRTGETKSEIIPYIKTFEKKVEEAVESSFENYFDLLLKNIQEFKEDRNRHLNEINSRISALLKSEETMTRTLTDMENDLSYIKTWGNTVCKN